MSLVDEEEKQRAVLAPEFYRKMLAVRLFEQRAIELYTRGEIRGVIHPYIGEEAVAVGACAVLKNDDYVVSTHRGHGHCIAKGASLDRMMAELLGRSNGYCRGKGGSMHVAAFEVRMLGAIGIVAAGIPIAVGAGLSVKLRKTGQVVICFFGDGAVNQGTFHEGVNLAAVWNLPVVFLCENNFYAISTHVSRVSAVTEVARRSCAYDIPGKRVDGNSVWAVYEAVQEAVARARDGSGPSLIEAVTYRYEGHYVGDPGHYRPSDELKKWRQNDPIVRLREELIAKGYLEPKTLEKLQQEVSQQVERAVDFARKSPHPAEEELRSDIYGGNREK